MNTNLLTLIDSFADLKVLVIGEAMLDSYLEGPTERLCREAPVPVVSVTEREHLPGGAANTAVNVASLGAQVCFLSVIGNDSEGELLKQALQSYDVSVSGVIATDKRVTLAKQRVIAANQMVVRFDQGSTENLDPETEKAFIQRLETLFPVCDAVIVSDYDYGVLTPNVIKTLKRMQQTSPRLLVVDSKRLKAYRKVNITAVKPNYGEALHLLGLSDGNGRGESVAHVQHSVRVGLEKEEAPPNGNPVDEREKSQSEGRVAQMINHGRRILKLTGAKIAAITLDMDGALIFEEERVPYRTYARPEPNSRAAGAGDTFISALSLALAAGAHTENAAELASAASSIVVSKDGTAACFSDELKAFFTRGDKVVTDAFQLTATTAAYRRNGQRIVFTNGCFDIIHRGHINYLNRAKTHGDILIVGLNSDDSVRRLKGPTRPINSLEDRAQVLAALSCVDHIVPFDADTPHDLIRLIKPDVFVKGGDYTRETLPEASLVEELGGEVKILEYLEEHSTTGIIERIRQIEAVEHSQEA